MDNDTKRSENKKMTETAAIVVCLLIGVILYEQYKIKRAFHQLLVLLEADAKRVAGIGEHLDDHLSKVQDDLYSEIQELSNTVRERMDDEESELQKFLKKELTEKFHEVKQLMQDPRFYLNEYYRNRVEELRKQENGNG